MTTDELKVTADLDKTVHIEVRAEARLMLSTRVTNGKIERPRLNGPSQLDAQIAVEDLRVLGEMIPRFVAEVEKATRLTTPEEDTDG
jgi:hypothetical protein